MRKIEPILQKLRELTDSVTDVEMCYALGINYSTLDNWKTKDEIPAKRLLEFSKKFDISIDALKNSVYKKNHSSLMDYDGYKIIKISHSASAGVLTDIDGVEVYDTDDFIFLSKNFFKTKINPEKTRVVEVVGDSMSPTLNSGDHVIINLSNEFVSDGIYVINYKNIFMVKMLQQKPDGSMTIRSINSLYENYDLKEEDQNVFYIIGKVIKTIS